MGLIVTTALSLSLWLVLWSIDVKAVDAFIVAITIILVTAGVRIGLAHRPDRDAIDR
jgi:hypothetical protein